MCSGRSGWTGRGFFSWACAEVVCAVDGDPRLDAGEVVEESLAVYPEVADDGEL